MITSIAPDGSHVGDFQRCSPVSGWEDEQRVGVTPSFLECRVGACSASMKAAIPPAFCRWRPHEGHRCLTASFWAVISRQNGRGGGTPMRAPHPARSIRSRINSIGARASSPSRMIETPAETAARSASAVSGILLSRPCPHALSLPGLDTPVGILGFLSAPDATRRRDKNPRHWSDERAHVSSAGRQTTTELPTLGEQNVRS